jgi:hypothetical protein
MGVSTDAILFYGYCWDEEDARNPWEIGCGDEDEDEDEDDWEARYARAKGCLPPAQPYPERTVTPTQANGWESTPKNYSFNEKALIKQHETYWTAKDKIAKASPCLVDRHCSASCPMAYVAVKKSVTTSNRGDPSEITSLAVDPAWNGQLAEFCETLGIKTKGKKAGWWLVSDWSE